LLVWSRNACMISSARLGLGGFFSIFPPFACLGRPAGLQCNQATKRSCG
jgi:hypothetical protein